MPFLPRPIFVPALTKTTKSIVSKQVNKQLYADNNIDLTDKISRCQTTFSQQASSKPHGAEAAEGAETRQRAETGPQGQEICPSQG